MDLNISTRFYLMPEDKKKNRHRRKLNLVNLDLLVNLVNYKKKFLELKLLIYSDSFWLPKTRFLQHPPLTITYVFAFSFLTGDCPLSLSIASFKREYVF